MEIFERRQKEENSVVCGLFSHFGARLVGKDKEVLSFVVDLVFSHSVLMSNHSREEPLLANEIKEHLLARGFQVRNDITEMVINKTIILIELSVTHLVMLIVG